MITYSRFNITILNCRYNSNELHFTSYFIIQGRPLRRVSGASDPTNSVDIQTAGNRVQNTREQGQDRLKTWQPGKTKTAFLGETIGGKDI